MSTANAPAGAAGAPTVECFFEVGSPTAYLAWTQLPKDRFDFVRESLLARR